MRVTTRNGQSYTVPVQPSDVKSIDFVPGGSAASSQYSGRSSDWFEPLGCFVDKSNRDLPLELQEHEVAPVTTERCTTACRAKGYTYAGTQYSSHCFCGNSYGRYGQANNCDARCAGDAGQICGGTWANSIYRVR